MNNYLSNLVGKALNRVPLARPHRASLFAPTPYSSGALGRSETTALTARFAHDEADALDGAEQIESPSPHANLSAARIVPAEDAGTGTPKVHRHAGAADEGIESERNDARQRFDREPPPALASPPPNGRFAGAQTQPATSASPRDDADDETRLTTIRAASSTRVDYEAGHRRLRAETRRTQADADAHEAASRETGAALARLQARLGHDEREAQRLENEIAEARADVRKRNAEELFQHRPTARTPDASAGGARAGGVREATREAASARGPKPPARPRDSRAMQLKPMPPALSPRPGIAAESKPNAPAPTIQVTIGRIEVRASQPSTPPSNRPRAAAPQLSLEEYLRRRDGGVQ
jgi:hypothetical protein